MTRSIQKQLKTRLDRRRQKKDHQKKEIHKRVQSISKKYTSKSTSKYDTDSSRSSSSRSSQSSTSSSSRSSQSSRNESSEKVQTRTKRQIKSPTKSKTKSPTKPREKSDSKPREKSDSKPREKSQTKPTRTRYREDGEDSLPVFKSSTYNDIDYPEPSRFRPLPSFTKPLENDTFSFNQDPLADALRMKREKDLPLNPTPSSLYPLQDSSKENFSSKYLGNEAPEEKESSETTYNDMTDTTKEKLTDYYKLANDEIEITPQVNSPEEDDKDKREEDKDHHHSSSEDDKDKHKEDKDYHRSSEEDDKDKHEEDKDHHRSSEEDDKDKHEEDKDHRRSSEEDKEEEKPAEEHEETKGKNFDESLMKHKFNYEYDQDGEDEPTEFYNSKRIEEFILEKGFMLLEYFTVGRFCTFILIQLPNICETVMVYVNRHRFPIDVSDSMYRKTSLEKLKVDKVEQDTNDYENMSLPGFDSAHLLDKMTDTNKQQKNLTYYVHRQISRLLYITQNIEIKPCILLNGIFGFYEMYHMPSRLATKEFYPVITLEILFSKTFLLEQNVPVFYQKFYTILNQSNRNKLDYLINSLATAMKKVQSIRSDMQNLSTREKDKDRIKQLVKHIEQRCLKVDQSRSSLSTTDVVTHSYQTRKLNEEKASLERKREDCNILYTDVKRVYDCDVFDQEITLHELYYKIRDIEEMIDYLQ
jgi:hypothetical protein